MSTVFENALVAGTCLDGAREGQYEIVSVLGAGGFAITYLGRDHLLADDVAIKEYLPAEIAVRRSDGTTVVPRDSSLSQDYQFGLEGFLAEARTLKRFRDRSIVRVENFIEANGTGYLIMEYEEGETLDSWIASRTLDEAQIKAIFVPLLDGLRAVHDANYLHRDIKPGNIYIRKDGSPVLLDFGAARQALGDHSRSITGVLTEGYAPFEQYSGRGLTPATDLYGLGATIYKCMTGETPPSAALRIEAAQLDEADPLDPATRRCAGRYSESLTRLVDDLLAPLARDRPQSAREVAERMLGLDETPVADATPSSPAVGAIDPPGNAAEPRSTPTPAHRRAREPVRQQRRRKPAPARNARQNRITIALFAIASIAIIVAPLFLSFDVTLTDRAEAGDPVAQYELGLQYLDGIGETPMSATEAHAWFQKASASGHPGGHFGMGLLYRRGAHVKYDAKTAFESFKHAAESGFDDAYAPLARLYNYGRGTAKNDTLARRWAGKAVGGCGGTPGGPLVAKADAGIAHAQFSLGGLYHDGLCVPQNYEQAAAWYRRAQSKGFASAYLNLAVLHQAGNGLPEDDRRAFELASAVAPRHVLAQVHVGNAYLNGNGVAADDASALRSYEIAAAKEYPEALINLGWMHQQGRGVPQNYGESIRLYEKAASLGHAFANYRLGVLHANGLGTAKDSKAAVRHYRKAADAGVLPAIYSLAQAYLLGNGVAQNAKESLRLHLTAANRGYADSQTQAGYQYSVGKGVARNDKTAFDWSMKAARQGNKAAQFNVGLFYETGRGVVANRARALEWYEKSTAQGNNGASKALTRLRR